ncbi:protease inhibitors-like [Bacillus rossius redtenbacheri]|uniref:protease inhibitors-like n=1 Tax=Bacillus rossius redtenbacheri TaxID=93214 RepID=UPI002FDED7FD
MKTTLVLLLCVAAIVATAAGPSGGRAEERCEPGTVTNDGCNTCTCTSTGVKACTLKLCLGPNKHLLTSSPDKNIMKSVKVLLLVAFMLLLSLFGALACVPNTTWKQDCNTCFCSENGQAACTLMGCISLPNNQPLLVNNSAIPSGN